VRAFDEDDSGAQVLVRLFEDNTDPRAIVLGFVQGQEYMSRGWVQALIASQGKSDDYQIMQRVAHQLTQTPEGRAWVAQVHVASQVLKNRVDELKAEALAAGKPGTNSDGEIDHVSWEDDDGGDGKILL